MKTIVLLKSKSVFRIIVLLGFVLGGCSGYYASVPADGIYGYRQVEIQHTHTPKRTKSSFYKNYFNNLSEQESFSQYDQALSRDSLHVDLEDYAASQDYQTYGPWGQTKSTTRIIINDYHPFDYEFGFYDRPWGFGFRPYYGYGNRFFFPYNRRFYHSWHRFYHPWSHRWHSPIFAFNPYLGYEYGYSNYWSPSPYRFWNPYPYYGHGWGYPVAYRNYRTEGYAGVSYVRNRRNQPVQPSESQNRKTRKAKEPKNTSSVPNSISTQLAFSRLQSSLVTPRYYGSPNPILTRSGSASSEVTTSQGNSNRTNAITSSTRSGSTNSSDVRQNIQRKSRVNTPRYQVSSSRNTPNSSVNSQRKSSLSSNTRYIQPRTTRNYQANVQSNRRSSSSVKRIDSQPSTAATKSRQSKHRSPSSSSYTRSNSHATQAQRRYSQPKTSRNYQSSNASFKSSSRSNSVSRSQSSRSTYSSSRSSSSNSRGRSSSSGRRN
ncbi:MAG: hypothetical protein OXC92_11665 [Flavobacteriaceae bacterium]|nr:hypothetical protein [Flavobacteriaceae bacterium]MCY4253690.1 hypothetical protein [Flavobacteriaceae bacterium]